MKDVALELERLSTRELRALAARYGLRPQGTSKERIVQQVAGWLSDPEVLREAVPLLSPAARLWADLLRLEPRPRIWRPLWPRLRERWLRDVPGVTDPAEAQRELQGWGWILNASLGKVLLNPALAALPPAFLSLPEGEPVRPTQPPLPVLEALPWVSGWVETARPRSPRQPTASPPVGSRLGGFQEWILPPPPPPLRPGDLAALARTLGGEEDLAVFLLHLLRAAGALHWIQGQLRVQAQSPLWSAPPDLLLDELLRTWWTLDPLKEWHEIFLALRRQGMALALRYRFSPADPLARLSLWLQRLRRIVLRFLRWLPPDRRYRREVLWEALFPLLPPPEGEVQDLRVQIGEGALLSLHQGLGLERTLRLGFEVLLEGPLTWLGLGVWDGEGWSFTPAGRALLQGRGPFPQLTGGRLPVEAVEADPPELRVGRGEGHTFPAHRLLRGLAAPRLKGEGLAYTLMPERLKEALHRHGSVDALLEALEEVLGAPLPEAGIRAIRRWGASYGAYRAYEGYAFLDTAEPAVLARILSLPGVKDLGLLPLSPTAALVPLEALEALVERLVEAGMSYAEE